MQDKNTQLSLSNAVVELETPDGKKQTSTDALGIFDFEMSLIAAETVELKVLANNYLPFSKTIVLQPNSTENVLVEMETLLSG